MSITFALTEEFLFQKNFQNFFEKCNNELDSIFSRLENAKSKEEIECLAAEAFSKKYDLTAKFISCNSDNILKCNLS